MDLAELTGKRLLAAAVEEKARRRRENRLAYYEPYEKQREFHNLLVRERLLMAANQTGKTWAGAFETAMHLTGLYPSWWGGRRFVRPVNCWCGGVTGAGVRDAVQRLLVGRAGAFGTGAIPKHLIEEVRSAQGTVDLLDHVKVRHVSGGLSVCGFRSYEQGREKWQAETLDFVWFDEEPPEDVYFEGVTRTNATGGFVFMTFTPVQGMSSVVQRFVLEKAEGTGVVTMTVRDAKHYTEEEAEKIIASYPAHEREARAFGVPSLGSGRVFPVAEDLIKVAAFSIPAHWPRIAGLDFGMDHPTACVWLAWDRDSDVVYVTDVYRRAGEVVAVHASAIKARGLWIPVAWPHDGLNETAAGPALAKQYRDEGVNMRPENAKLPVTADGRESSRVSVEAGLSLMLGRMQTGRFLVFSHLEPWFEEFRLYHRKDGRVVKKMDDLMSATRIAMMDLRYAKVKDDASVVTGLGTWKPFDPAVGY